MDPALPGDRDDRPARQDRPDTAGRVEQVVLARLVWDGSPGPVHQPVPTPHPHVLLLGPEEPESRAIRQDSHQGERIGPAEVVEAVDRRAGRQELAALQAEPEVPADDRRGREARDPVPDGPPEGADRRTGQARTIAVGHGCQIPSPGAAPGRLAPIRSGSRSARRSRTRSARAIVPAAGGTLRFGTRTTNIPAAFPARTPL